MSNYLYGAKWDGYNAYELRRFIGDNLLIERYRIVEAGFEYDPNKLVLNTKTGHVLVNNGEWIVKCGDEYSVMSDDDVRHNFGGIV